MNYGAKKRIVEAKARRIKRIVGCIAAIFVLALCVFGHFYPPSSWKYYVSLPKISKRQVGEMRLHFLDVGQGDCVLVELPNGEIALVDGGEATGYAERSLLRYCNALDIDCVDHLIVTHTDGDHCGALRTFLKYKKVVNAYLPRPSETVDGTYASFFTSLSKTSANITYYARSQELYSKRGGHKDDRPFTFAFLYPYSSDVENDSVPEGNEGSAVIWIDYRGVSTLLTGDAPFSVEDALLQDDKDGYLSAYGVDLTSTEILKVSHHGSADATSLAFLRYLGVERAVISCGKANLYGHPTRETLDRLEDANADVYRTDEDGHIVVTIDASGAYSMKTVKR